MKKMLSLAIGLCVSTIALAHSSTTTTLPNHHHTTNQNSPITFVESGIEFAVFNDGQFDFNVLDPVVGAHINTRYIDFSFNTGHNYDTYLQYDDYGAVIQIENTPINYDYYGRVNRIGNIYIGYNNRFGLVSRVGSLYLSYNAAGNITRRHGFINRFNRDRIVRRRCNAYRAPRADRRIVAYTPYRRDFTPRRCNYNTYRRNYANRTVNNNNRTRYNNNIRSRRDNLNARPNYRIAPRVVNTPNRTVRNLKNRADISNRRGAKTERSTSRTITRNTGRDTGRNTGRSTTRVAQKTVVKKTPRTNTRTNNRDAVVVTRTERTFRTR